MRSTTKPSTLAAVALIATGLGWLVLRALHRDGNGPVVTWLVVPVLLALCTVVLVTGWQVRQYQREERKHLDMLRASRTVALAKAASLTGAVLCGWYLAHILLRAPDLGVATVRESLISTAVATVLGGALSGCGLLAEHWCKLPPDSGDGQDPANGRYPWPGDAPGEESPSPSN